MKRKKKKMKSETGTQERERNWEIKKQRRKPDENWKRKINYDHKAKGHQGLVFLSNKYFLGCCHISYDNLGQGKK
jgi:hypothetical protein